MINIQIEIKKPDRFKDLLHKAHDKTEDMMFSIFQKFPERFIPSFFMEWMEHYTNKRLSELKQQLIRNKWHTIELEKAVENIHNQQQS